MSTERQGVVSRIMKSISKIEPNELRAVIVSFLFVFTLMASYYIMRPVRDAMASDWTDTELSFLWNINFFVSVSEDGGRHSLESIFQL